MNRTNDQHVQLSRRAMLQGGVLVLSGLAARPSPVFADTEKTALKIGLITDLHYADKPPAGSRHYRETLGKLRESAEKFAEEKPDFVVELGDLIDAADSVEKEQQYLKTVNEVFSGIARERHCVLGNHCVDTLTKEEFLAGVGQQKSYYSFDRAGFHFVVLDSCFRTDGHPYQRKNFRWTDANVPPAELDWLKDDLKTNGKPVIVFAHQRLDVSNSHGVRNCVEVRRVLEGSGNVLAVFQGHSHQNDLKEIGGIHYCTQVAMVEGSGAANNAYSVMELSANGTIRLRGFRKQASRELQPE